MCPLLAGLQIAVKLRRPIPGDMPVGTLIDGVVAGNVVAKHAVATAADSPVKGRIRRMERYKPVSLFHSGSGVHTGGSAGDPVPQKA